MSLEPDLPPTSLILCTRNRPALLRDTVGSILRGSDVPGELIIVDQSDQPHAELASWQPDSLCRIQYRWISAVGLCRARNEGVATAINKVLIFVDDDMLVAPDWHKVLVKSLILAGQQAVVTGRVLPGAPERTGAFPPSLVPGDRPQVYEGRIGTDALAAGNMAMYRTTIKDVGPFDERLGAGSAFPAADDNDYGYRLLEAGYRIVYVPEAVVYHRAWRDAKDYLPLRWDYGRGKGGFYAKYSNFRDPYLLRRMIRDVLLRIARFPWRALHRPRLAMGDLVYSLGVMLGFVRWRLSRS